jgi:hypothetical protein
MEQPWTGFSTPIENRESVAQKPQIETGNTPVNPTRETEITRNRPPERGFLGISKKAAEGTRTLDLLHGKQTL